MTAPEPVAIRCKCSHSKWRHAADRYACRSRACGCTTYRPQEQEQ